MPVTENLPGRVIAIIPARGGSKRLPGKNIFPLRGKPLIAYTIEACLQSKYIHDVFVSSDDETILRVSKEFGAIPLHRPTNLADDHTPKVVAVRQAVQDPLVTAGGPVEVVLIAQANSPQITAEQLDRGMHMLIDHQLWEVMSADANGVQNAAFRFVRYHALFNAFLSAHCGFVVAENTDVHTLEDIQRLEKVGGFRLG